MPPDPDAIARAYQDCRAELLAYLTRMVVRAEVAEDLLQETALRLTRAERAPDDLDGMRAWMFRVATRLAIDHLRRHSTWRETVLIDIRARADRDQAFVAESRLLAGSPEMSAIAREHLAVCFACTLRNFPPAHAAALMLVEVYGFTVAETAEILEVTFGQAKHWLQSCRTGLRARYDSTCALVNKQGVCHQCVELGAFFNDRPEDPLAGTTKDLDARLEVLRERRAAALGPWHRLMMRLVDDVLGGGD